MPRKKPSLMDRDRWSDPKAGWLEEHLQAAIVIWLRQNGFAFEVGMEGVRLSKSQRSKAKIQGMEPGRCDLKVLLPGGRTVHIELKRAGGRVSPDQKRWHDQLRGLGFEVHVVFASCPDNAVGEVSRILRPDDDTAQLPFDAPAT